MWKIHDRQLTDGGTKMMRTTAVIYKHFSPVIEAEETAEFLNERSVDAQGRMMWLIHSQSCHFARSHLPRTVFLLLYERFGEGESKPAFKTSSFTRLFLPDVASWYLAALDRILPRLRIAAAHRISPVTPRGLPSSSHNKPKNRRRRRRRRGKGRRGGRRRRRAWDQGTYSCSDRSQLHEPVRTDGADVPGCPGGRVQCGDPRSNQQPGIHPQSTVVNERRSCVKRSGRGRCLSLYEVV